MNIVVTAPKERVLRGGGGLKRDKLIQIRMLTVRYLYVRDKSFKLVTCLCNVLAITGNVRLSQN